MLLLPHFQLALTRKKKKPKQKRCNMRMRHAYLVAIPRNQFLDARGRKASKSFCEPMAYQNAHLTQPKTMHCDVQALQREKFFRFCKRLRYIPKMCLNPAAPSPSPHMTTHLLQQPAWSSFSFISILWPGGYDPIGGAPPPGDDISLLYRRISRTRS